MMTDERRALEALLSLKAPGTFARSRTHDAFGKTKPICLFGAGSNGHHIARQLASGKHNVVAFIDETPAKQGGVVAGLPVMSIAQALHKFGDQVSIVSTVYLAGKSFAWLKAKLALSGLKRVFPLPLLGWRYTRLLPFYFFEPLPDAMHRQDDIHWLFNELEDTLSRIRLVEHLKLRLALDFDPPSPTDLRTFGLDQSNFNRIHYVDCGAYDGDTMRAFLKLCDRDRISGLTAIEADPTNFNRLVRWAKEEHIVCLQSAVGAKAGTVQFSSCGNLGSSVSVSGGLEVPVVALDDILAPDESYMIKFDVEGYEAEALEGCQGLIATGRSILGISVYHRPQDLFDLPRKIRRLNPNYRLFLRAHDFDGMDLTLYAIPN